MTPKAKYPSQMNKDELKAELRELGVPAPHDATKLMLVNTLKSVRDVESRGSEAAAEPAPQPTSGLDELKAQVAQQAQEIAALKNQGIPSANEPEEPEGPTPEELAETELRKYVRRSGGMRKNSTPDDKVRAKKILGILGRKKLKWDENILLGGDYDRCAARPEPEKK